MNKDRKQLHTAGWTLLSKAASLCKRLIWLRDTDSSLPLAAELLPLLSDALTCVALLEGATSAVCEKMVSTYDRALGQGWVGVGAAGGTTRLGTRTTQVGLMRAREYALSNRSTFQLQARTVAEGGTNGTTPDWKGLFRLTETFIDALDWGEFVIENPRGQVSNLVLECVELLEAIEHKEQNDIQEEIGDVFYNLMAFCLSLRIGASDIASEGPNALQAARTAPHERTGR